MYNISIVRKKTETIMNKFKRILISSTLAFITAIVFIIAVGQFSVSLTQYKLLNSKTEQTIVLQEMSHIAMPSFYNQVNQDISFYKDLGYIHLFEGLHIRNEKDLAKLNDLIGFNLSLGKSIGTASGLSSQNNHLKIENNDVRADTNSDVIIKEFQKRNINNNEIKILDSIERIENNEFNKWLVKSLLRTGLRIHKTFGDKIIMLDGMKEIILDKRNDILIQHIRDNKSHLFITYGAAHIKDIREYLLKNGFMNVDQKEIEVF